MSDEKMLSLVPDFWLAFNLGISLHGAFTPAPVNLRPVGHGRVMA